MNIISLEFEYKTKYLLNSLKRTYSKDNETSKINPKKIPHRQNNSKNTTPSEQF